MSEKVFIPIILGTVRKGRESENVANFLFNYITKKREIETQLFDIRKMNLPMNDEGPALKDKNSKYKNTIMRADGIIIVCPEYNHGYPGSLKRALDILTKEYTHKAVGIVGVSAGEFGGARVIEQVTQVTRELGLVSISVNLNFSKIRTTFNKNVELKDKSENKSINKHINGFLEELVWMSKTLRWGRENLK